MQYGGVTVEVFSNSEGVECTNFNSFGVGKLLISYPLDGHLGLIIFNPFGILGKKRGGGCQ